MRSTVRVIGLGAAVLGAAAAFAAPASASAPAASALPVGQSDHGRLPASQHAVFVQTDDPTGNSVIAYDRAADGSLSQTGVYPTGGLGGQLSGSVVDHTASQGSLAYDASNRLLYAVNSGSDTITSFAVRGSRLIRLQTISSGGQFPVSLTVHDGTLYVLNARGGGSIQGYLRFGAVLVEVPAWRRALGFNPAPSPEFTSTPGQIAFTPDGSKLIVTTKGDGQSIEVYPVSPFGLAPAPVVTADPGNVPFAIAFDRHDNLVIAEAGPSALATFAVNHDATLTLLARSTTGQAATCWVTSTGSRLYASNAGSADVSGFSDHHGVLAPLTTTGTDAGTVDSAATPDGRFLYVQTGARGVVDEFAIAADGSLHEIGSVTAPDAVGGEGIVAS